MAKKEAFPDIAELSFEEAMKELEDTVRKLESGNLDLEQSIKDYERGAALKAHCEKKLKEAKLKVEKILVTNDGEIETQPFDEAEAS